VTTLSGPLGHTWGVRSTRGRLLVATPPLVDPNFDRTVVFMLEHNEQGALGLVLNRPSTVPVAGVLPEWASTAMWPTVVFTGGPVQSDALIGLARRASPAEGWSPLVADIGTVDLSIPAADIAPLSSFRLFAGYSGWSSGQLEGELLTDSWLVVDAEPTDPFTAEPSALWRHVMARQGGSLGWMINYPDDVRLN
jgi:putative transcriptional regulator